jgi:hypothetical protein
MTGSEGPPDTGDAARHYAVRDDLVRYRINVTGARERMRRIVYEEREGNPGAIENRWCMPVHAERPKTREFASPASTQDAALRGCDSRRYTLGSRLRLIGVQGVAGSNPAVPTRTST